MLIQLELDKLFVEWEGSKDINLFDVFFDPSLGRPQSSGLQALYLTERKVAWIDALTYCGTLDTFTPNELKGTAYYALQAAIFCYSTRPTSVIHVPKGFEKLTDYFLEDKENRRRYFREKDLVGILKDRQMLKHAIQFLVEKGVLEQKSIGEFAVKRRPIKKLNFL